MDEIIELALTTTYGIVDCRLDPERNDGEFFYTITILYPNMVNGFNRSEIYCHVMRFDTNTGGFVFEAGDDNIHPKIRQLEKQISEAIAKAV